MCGHFSNACSCGENTMKIIKQYSIMNNITQTLKKNICPNVHKMAGQEFNYLCALTKSESFCCDCELNLLSPHPSVFAAPCAPCRTCPLELSLSQIGVCLKTLRGKVTLFLLKPVSQPVQRASYVAVRSPY